MARKTGATLKRALSARAPSWAAVGVDTSLTAISAVATAYDALTGSRRGPFWAEVRWLPEDDYFIRLGQASKTAGLIYDVLKEAWVRDYDNIYIAIEEPWYFGAAKHGQSGWLKQQAEVAGAFKAGLVNNGYLNIYEINNSQWRKVLRQEGVTIRRGAEGKWDVKEWAINAYGLPDFPDLVKSKSGAKIPRPESGYGAKAKPVQPSDIYDAAACAAWMQDHVERLREEG